MFEMFIKKIIDPSKPTLLTIYDDKRVCSKVAHNYILFYNYRAQINIQWTKFRISKSSLDQIEEIPVSNKK